MTTGCKKSASDDIADSAATAVSVQAAHPTVGPIAPEIAADAILTPLAAAALSPRISAPIRQEFVQRGAHVRKGELLLTLEDRDLEGNAVDARGAVTSAQAAYANATDAAIPETVQKARLDVDQAKANLDVADRTAQERKRLFTQGAIPGRDVDVSVAAAVQAQAAYDTAVKHLQSVQNTTRHTDAESAQGQLTSARGRLINADAQVEYSSLRSPISGIVTDRPFFPGESVPGGTAAITVMDTSSLIAKLHIAQASAQKLRVGDTAQLTIPGVDHPQPATLSLVSPALDPGSTTVEVWLKLANPADQYKVGTPVHAILHGNTIPNALLIPSGAIVPGENGATDVLVVSPDNVAKKRAVTIGIRTANEAQVLDGLSTSDTIVTEGGYGLDDGTKVTIGGDKDQGDAVDKGDKQ
jgi:multidrug resistance efflux pump